MRVSKFVSVGTTCNSRLWSSAWFRHHSLWLNIHHPKRRHHLSEKQLAPKGIVNTNRHRPFHSAPLDACSCLQPSGTLVPRHTAGCDGQHQSMAALSNCTPPKKPTWVAPETPPAVIAYRPEAAGREQAKITHTQHLSRGVGCLEQQRQLGKETQEQGKGLGRSIRIQMGKLSHILGWWH